MERSKAVEVTIRVRPEVAAFAVQMEQKLRENDNKPHWRYCTPEWLQARLDEEVEELREAILWDKDPQHIAEEAADVGNFSMFIADVAGGLDLDIESVGTGLDGPKEIEEIEPVDPFADVANRYRLFCLNHGAESPEEMKHFVDEVGGPFYMVWISGWLRKWKGQHGYNADYILTDDDHAAFDDWLEEQVLRGDEE